MTNITEIAQFSYTPKVYDHLLTFKFYAKQLSF